MNDQRGFTLVEVLAALVVGGLLLASLSWVLADLSKDLRATNRHDDLAQVESIAPFLKALLESALPPSQVEPQTVTAGHVVLTVPPPRALANAGPLRLDLTVDRTSAGAILVARFASEDGAPLPQGFSTGHALAAGFRRIDITRSDTSDSSGAITLTFVPKTGDPVSIVAKPRLSSDSNCRFDPISMSCRA